MKPKKGKVSPLRAKIAKRDEWICQLCFDKIETLFDLTIDHVIPKSKGGTDAQINCKATHRECNGLKGDSELILSPEYYKRERKKIKEKRTERKESN